MSLQNNKEKNNFLILQKWYLSIFILVIFGCQSDDDVTTPTAPIDTGEDLTSSFWFIEDKGWIFEFTEGNDIFFNINSAGCAIQNDNFIPEEFFGFTFNQISENEMIATSELSDIDVILTRLEDQNPSCLPDQISLTDDPLVNFDHFWNIFNDYYAFFEARNIDWAPFESLREQVTTDNLYETIEELALLLDDAHVSIVDDSNDIDIISGDQRLLERLNANLSGDLSIENFEDLNNLGNEKLNTIAIDYLGDNFEIDENENIFWGLINDNVGYVNILTMEGYGTNFENEISTLNTVLDTMLNDINVSGVSNLIIDLRFNDGGFDTVALDIVSRFTDQERVSYFKKARLGDGFTENVAFSVGPKGDFQFTNDIVILTSPFSVSAAELFLLCAKDLPNVTIVGENSSGAFSTILEHTLPNGAQVGLSNEVYSDAQGEVFEIVGIGPENPENEIPFLSNQDFENEIDGGIERALEILDN